VTPEQRRSREQDRASGGWELIDDEECRRATAIVERIGRRWNSGILLALARGATRFTEILARVEGLSDRMLAARLKELEQIGLVVRIVEPTTPVSVRYRLTPRGRELLAALQPLAAYGQKWERDAGELDGPPGVSEAHEQREHDGDDDAGNEHGTPPGSGLVTGTRANLEKVHSCWLQGG
jgi:DNA-binding HxlR family transcriptional regulator